MPRTALPLHEPTSPGGTDDLVLPASLRAAGTARRRVQRVLSSGCCADDLDVAVLLTSELVTNAVLHGAAPIVLRLQHRGASLRVEVRDAGAALLPHAARGLDLTAESGRGLALVAALATCWGSTVHDGPPVGKTVWFEIVRSAPPAAERS